VAEDLLCRRSPKPLQPALGVAKRQPKRAADGQVEDPAGRPASNRPAGATGAGADRHRRLTKRPHDPVKVDGPIGAVGVGEDNQLSPGGQHPRPHGEPLATVGMVRQHPNAPINCGDGFSHRDGGIGRAVIHHQHLDLARDTGEMRQEGL
jgi:hypothetical protein